MGMSEGQRMVIIVGGVGSDKCIVSGDRDGAFPGSEDECPGLL